MNLEAAILNALHLSVKYYLVNIIANSHCILRFVPQTYVKLIITFGLQLKYMYKMISILRMIIDSNFVYLSKILFIESSAHILYTDIASHMIFVH